MLEKEREQIDTLDEQIMQLLDKRFALTDKVGQIKKENKLAIEHQSREIEIYQKIKNTTKNKREIEDIYHKIMDLSKQRQRNL